MHRSFALLALGALPVVAGACGEHKKPTTYQADPKRSDLVQATASAPVMTATPTASVRPNAPAPARRLCKEGHPALGKSLPALALEMREAAPAPKRPAGRISTTAGRWTWVNLWAAWCGPCRQEIPLLRTWEARLAAQGAPLTLAFVSLDDDERQMQKFLDEQPEKGLKLSWWLPESKRTGWLEALRLSDAPQLPVHVLLDGKGATRCVIDGAVEEVDWPAVQNLLSHG